tara:strand:+ start:3324 stop:4613 length:1290 start_codon:yes stop_codon:yes gene_type:complete
MIEFNPKGNNILDQEIAVSGLVMDVDPGLAFGINAGLSVLGLGLNFFGQQSAASAQRDALRNQQRIASANNKYNRKVARKTNAYNDKQDAVDLANYRQERAFAFKSLTKDWEYGRQIHKLEHLNRMQEFKHSRGISKKQGKLNADAERFAIKQEKESLRDTVLQQSFARESNLSALRDSVFEGMLSKKKVGLQIQGIKSRQAFGSSAIQESINNLMTSSSIEKEAAMVEGLLAEGKAELGQAGKSTQKGKQSSSAALYRGLRSLNNQLSGKYTQAATQLAQLQAESSIALSGAKLDLVGIQKTINIAQEDFDFNNRVINANIDSAIEAAKRNIRDIQLDRDFADLEVEANRILRPSKLPYQPRPMLPKERIFLPRMEVLVPDKLKKFGSGPDKLERALERGDVVTAEEHNEKLAAGESIEIPVNTKALS